MHEDPQVPQLWKKGYGNLVEKGMCIAIEPMINVSDRQIVMENDGWTVTRIEMCSSFWTYGSLQ